MAFKHESIAYWEHRGDRQRVQELRVQFHIGPFDRILILWWRFALWVWDIKASDDVG